MKIFSTQEADRINNFDNENKVKDQDFYSNSKELVFKWNPKIHKELKEMLPKTEQVKLAKNRTVTQCLATTIKYLNLEQQNNAD